MTAAQYRRARARAFRIWREETCAQMAALSMLNENSSEVLDENSPVWRGDYEVG
jgi:hypothetical protein